MVGLSGVDGVVDGVDGGPVELDAEVEKDRHEALWAPCFEGLLGFPDVEHFDLAVRFEGDVLEPSDGCSVSGGIEPSDRLVVLLGGEARVPEMSGDCHVGPLVGGRVASATSSVLFWSRLVSAGCCGGEQPRLLGLEQREGVAIGVFEPCRLADAGGGRDMVDGLERREVVVLEDDAPGGHLGDVVRDIV
jgi:hypothetical protein